MYTINLINFSKVIEKDKIMILNTRFVIMKILLVSATEHELSLFEQNSNNVDILISGIGIAPITYSVTKKLLESDYDIAIQAGIAGTFTDELNLAEVVLISADTFGDSGIEEAGIFKNLFSSGLANENDFPYKSGWLLNTHELLVSTELKTVRAITVNKITDDQEQIEQQRIMFNPQVESMEGAAFHYVCLQQNVPFVQIRGISNRVGERNKIKWEMQKAIGNLNKELNKIIQILSQ
jgi:futalosine hydrolase